MGTFQEQKRISVVIPTLGRTDPLRETFLLGIYGMTLSALFFALQAPDVALSEIVVGTIGLPLIILAALRKVREQERARKEEREREK